MIRDALSAVIYLNLTSVASKVSKDKVKVKFTLNRPRNIRGEYSYSCTLSLTSALERVGGQRHASAHLPPGKTCYPLYRRLGGPQDRSRQVTIISPQLRFDPRTVHPVASCYTD